MSSTPALDGQNNLAGYDQDYRLIHLLVYLELIARPQLNITGNRLFLYYE
jgi:hypothetical protein